MYYKLYLIVANKQYHRKMSAHARDLKTANILNFLLFKQKHGNLINQGKRKKHQITLNSRLVNSPSTLKI